ncbi:secreted protein [Candidatus Thiomargarita nelsonii]|uniref:Secreted protein n=1 Tax=Candidatus Thiomargarita nelsonii TaxID=1003181 RepID=A0A176RVT9_9GAMM|nr:secreted protein [Candidatus Thiomargarita nelsonii]
MPVLLTALLLCWLTLPALGLIRMARLHCMNGTLMVMVFSTLIRRLPVIPPILIPPRAYLTRFVR